MQPPVLSMPTGALMRPTAHVFVEDSLAVAASRLRHNQAELVPVIDGNRLVGVVSERSLAKAIGEGAQPNDAVTTAMVDAPRCAPYTTGAEALRLFDSLGAGALVVADDEDHVAGMLLPSDLIAPRRQPLAPPLIGGMATPFGVYLTTGAFGAGASSIALITTGMTMFAMILVANLAAVVVGNFAVAKGLAEGNAEILASVLTIAFFVLQMRLIPLSGIHAAEHKVVHAIERGEELNRENVRRMPRVHPRCGTNLAVGATLFSGIWSLHFPGAIDDFKLIIAAVVTYAFWRPLGSLAQYWVTTKPPSDRQLDMGIRSGRELLDKYQRAHMTVPGIGRRLANSGLFHVILGSVLCFGLVKLVLLLFGQKDLLGIMDF